MCLYLFVLIRFTDTHSHLGGDLIFYGERDDVRVHYSHEPGTAVMHVGKNYHEADKITRGERSNLIIWCKCANRRYIKKRIECDAIAPYVCTFRQTNDNENTSSNVTCGSDETLWLTIRLDLSYLL
jgi:predicted 2-oxoglutarate/Fe(II)-dependent dioxygenase YbiX